MTETVCPAGTSTVAGSNVNFQPVGPVALMAAAATSAVPVFDRASVTSLVAPAVAFMLRRWSEVDRLSV